MMNTANNIKHEVVVESAQDELKAILYDEAYRLSGNHEDAEALAEEAYRDFKRHHLQYC